MDISRGSRVHQRGPPEVFAGSPPGRPGDPSSWDVDSVVVFHPQHPLCKHRCVECPTSPPVDANSQRHVERFAVQIPHQYVSLVGLDIIKKTKQLKNSQTIKQSGYKNNIKIRTTKIKQQTNTCAL
jgi:hypothetical protein